MSLSHEVGWVMDEKMPQESSPVEQFRRRDAANARVAQAAARSELQQVLRGYILPELRRYWSEHVSSLRSIAATPFHAMVELDLYSLDGAKSRCVLYGNTETRMNEVLKTTNGELPILSWTHPAVQLGLSADLGEKVEVNSERFRVTAVTPFARGTFEQVLPDIVGLYEPGGAVPVKKPTFAPQGTPAPIQPEPSRQERKPAQGLRSVKLHMTRQQVEAFVSRMKGMMIVTGAPGTGKTTVALQRVRFLYDQQDQRVGDADICYEPKRTKIFLGNANLFAHCRHLLEKELGIPHDLVSLVPDFVRQYLRQVWAFKSEARLRSRKVSPFEQRARAAVFGLCNKRDLLDCWKVYEEQIASRLAEAERAEWLKLLEGQVGPPVRMRFRRLAAAFAARRTVSKQADPRRSGWRMQAVYESVRGPYEELRESLDASAREAFDHGVRNWLFWVYDPLDAVASFFQEKVYEATVRIRKGTAARANEEEVFDSIVKDWDRRQYGPEEEPWLAWLLRFALPETADPARRFRLVPWAFGEDQTPETRWTHIVIDEAQDLSVAEASLLSSLVDPRGAMTVSADFRQIVSPVHGMTDPEAFQLGSAMAETGTIARFPFAQNLRQSRSIGIFLKKVYESAFGETAPFEANPAFDDGKPMLLLTNASGFPKVIKQIFSALSRSETVSSVCLLQINEDEEEMKRLRVALEALGVPLAPLWETQESMEEGKDGSNQDSGRRLITTSVERAKGLEYDACIVLGLDDVEQAALNFSKNRAYVALSRPTRRLIMLCQEIPALLHKVNKTAFEIRRID